MSLQVKILGSGCAKCKNLEKITREVLAENNIEAEVSKVEDINEIMKYNIFVTPALVINEKVVIKGRLPAKTEIKNHFESFQG